MTSKKKKQREEILTREFICHVPELSNANVRQSEKPDIILDLPGSHTRSIGLEVTEYYQGPKGDYGSELRLTEAHCTTVRRRITQALRAPAFAGEFERRHGIGNCVAHLVDLAPEDFNNLIGDLARFIRLADTTDVKFEAEHELDYPHLFRHIGEITISRRRVWMTYMVECMGGCSAGMLGISTEEVQNALAGKKGLAATYRAHGEFSEVILLIAAAGDRISNTAGSLDKISETVTPLRELMASLGFDRIYFYSRDDDDVAQLHPPVG